MGGSNVEIVYYDEKAFSVSYLSKMPCLPVCDIAT